MSEREATAAMEALLERASQLEEASGFAGAEELEACRSQLIHEEGSLMLGGLVFPALSRELNGFKIENTLF